VKTVIQKKRGRPPKGRDPLVPVRLPVELVHKIDDWARKYEGMNRSVAIRCLLEFGLRTPRAKREQVRDPKDLAFELLKGKTYKLPKMPKSAVEEAVARAMRTSAMKRKTRE
jgi:hypothetical protein